MQNKFFLLVVVGAGLMLAGAGCEKAGVTSNTAADSAAMHDEAMQKEDGAMMGNKDAMTDEKGMMMKDDASADAMKKDGVMMKNETTGDTMMKDDKKEGAMMDDKQGAGTYEDYTASKLAWAKDGKVILFFKASWCPTCQAVDKDILAHLGNIPSKTYILKVDYDTSAELKKKYGVTYQHTFVQVDANGTMIKKWSGSPTLTALTAEIK